MTKRQKANLWSNIVLIILELIGFITLFALPIIISGEPTFFDELHVFKFYTTDSNVLLMISSIIVVICIALQSNKKIKKIPEWVNLLKLISLACTTLTMVSVLVFVPLYPYIWGGSPVEMFTNSNLFYHLLGPLWGFISYLLFETKPTFKWPWTLFSLVPTGVYSIAYMSTALTHLQSDGNIDMVYDWYELSGMCKLTHLPIPLVATGAIILALVCTYLFAWIMWFGNKQIQIKKLGES